MEYPAREDIGDELVLLIYQNGGSGYQMRTCDTYGPLGDKFTLSKEARFQTLDECTCSGSSELKWNNEVRFAREELAADKYLDRNAPHGVWRLTEKGVKYARWLLELGNRLREMIPIAMQQFREQVARRRALMQNVGTGDLFVRN